MLRLFANPMSHPLLWVNLLLTLLVGFAVWRLGLALLRMLCQHINPRLGTVIAWVWHLALLYTTLSASVYVLRLDMVPLLYDSGEVVVGGFRASSGQVIVVGAIAFIAWNLVTLASERVVPDSAGGFTRRAVRVRTLKGVITGSLRLVIVLLTLISLLQAVGINASALLAGVSVFGLAVGFGAQSLIKDIFTGFFILLEDQYGVGDLIAVNNSTLSGTVERLTLRVTALRALDGTVHIIPNGQVLTVSVSSKDWSQVVAAVDVAAGADVDRAISVLDDVTRGLYQDPDWQHHFLAAPDVQGVTKLTPDVVTIRALLKVLPKSQFPVSREFNRRMKLALDAAGINTPPPAAAPLTITPISLNPVQVRLVRGEMGDKEEPRQQDQPPVSLSKDGANGSS